MYVQVNLQNIIALEKNREKIQQCDVFLFYYKWLSLLSGPLNIEYDVPQVLGLMCCNSSFCLPQAPLREIFECDKVLEVSEKKTAVDQDAFLGASLIMMSFDSSG